MITDGTITLRPPRAGDVEPIVAACADPEIPRWTPVPSPYAAEDAVAWIERAHRRNADEIGLDLVAVEADGGGLLGAIGFAVLDRPRGVAEVGYWVAPWARRRGIAARAVRLLCRHGEERLGLHTVRLLAHRDNTASIAVAERAGFAPTGEVVPAPRTEPPGEPTHLVYVWRPARAT